VVSAGGGCVRRRAPLSRLLARLDGIAEVELAEVRQPDPRRLMVQLAGQLHRHHQLLARFAGRTAARPAATALLPAPLCGSMRGGFPPDDPGKPTPAMSIKASIQAAMVQAMRERDRPRKDALSFLLSEMKTAAINRRVPELADPEAIALLQKQLRQREESRDAARQAGRADLVAASEDEIALI